MVILQVMIVWQKQFFEEQLKEAEREVNQENLGYPTSKNGPKLTYIPSSPLLKIANCGEVCASPLVPLRHKPREDDDDDYDDDMYNIHILFVRERSQKSNWHAILHDQQPTYDLCYIEPGDIGRGHLNLEKN